MWPSVREERQVGGEYASHHADGSVYRPHGTDRDSGAARTRRWIVASRDQGRSFGQPRPIASNVAPEAVAGDYIPAAANGVLAVSYVAQAADPSCLCRQVFETSRDDGVTRTRHPAPIPA